MIFNDFESGTHELFDKLLPNFIQFSITYLYIIRMSNKFSQAMQQRFMKDLEQITANPDDSDNGSEESQDYYEYERKRMEAALSMLKTRQNNSILEELKKTTQIQVQYIDQFNDQVVDLHNITRNNKQNVLQESVIKEIKERVFNQSTLSSIQLADQQLEKKKQKQQATEKQQKIKSNSHSKENSIEKQVDNKLILKIQKARVERELIDMAREDDLSLRYELQCLSNFFSERFYTPEFKIPKNKQTSVKIDGYAPKTTFTNLRPLPNTQNNVLPRNAPELALKRLSKVKKIKFVASSMTEVPVKIKKLNPEEEQKSLTKKSKIEKDKNQIQQSIQAYLKFIKPHLSSVQSASKNYRPKFINEFPNQNEQNFNIDEEVSEIKSIEDCLDVEKPDAIKDIKLTFEKINILKGIDKYINAEHASLQFNAITSLSCIQKCSKLIQLNLSHNKIKSIDSLKHLKWLKTLNIEHNVVESIQLKGGSMQVLLASHNRIQQIVHLSSNVYLKRLAISNNNLHKLGGLNKLYFLQQIDAHKNYIDSLQGIQECILLRNLNICSNRLKQLHPNFTYIFLNKLLASGNSISQLPNMFLPSLEELYFDHNKIQIQSSSLLYFPSLKVLNLDDNRLSGFCVVWSFVKYSRILQTIKYDKNSYFLDIRQKVKELYEYIFYRSMSKLKILNQSPFDIGVKKYYQGVYSTYLSSKNLFKPESLVLEQINKKIRFMIHQNEFMSKLQDRKIKFSQSDTFISHKSVMKIKDLMQIVDFLNDTQVTKILHATKSLFYEHDRFQYKMRDALHKIKNVLISKEHYLRKKKQFYQSKKEDLANLFKYLNQFIKKVRILQTIAIFHRPLQGMGQEKAAIIIQKNWRCYRMRKRYLRVMAKLKKNKELDSDMEDLDMDEYDFDKVEIPVFNFEIPDDIDFDQYIIKPEVFEMLNKKEQKQQAKLQNKVGGKQEGKGQMVNNFIEENESQISEVPRASREEQQINRLMRQWGISREVAMTKYHQNLMKQRKKEKQKQLSAAERYQNYKRQQKR